MANIEEGDEETLISQLYKAKRVRISLVILCLILAFVANSTTDPNTTSFLIAGGILGAISSVSLFMGNLFEQIS